MEFNLANILIMASLFIIAALAMHKEGRGKTFALYILFAMLFILLSYAQRAVELLEQGVRP